MKTEQKFIGLDHLRALAISLVFLFHYGFFSHPAWIERFSHFGWTGVDLFFILSGFLISSQLFAEWQKRNTISLKTFYIKRAFRILPPYFFILLLYIFIPAFHERERLAPLWKMFTFTQNFNQDISVYGTFSHAWSLCVEEQFYFLFPLLLLVIFSTRLKRKAAWLIPVFFLLPLGLRWINWDFYLAPVQHQDSFMVSWYRLIYYPTYTRIDGLITGIALAAIYRFKKEWLIPTRPYANGIAGFIFLLIIASCFSTPDNHSGFSSIFGFSIIAIILGFLVSSSLSAGSFLDKSKSFLTQHLATLSYSIYLSHKGLIHLTQTLLAGTGIAVDGTFMFIICVVVCISGALIMRVVIEKPALKLRNKVLSYYNNKVEKLAPLPDALSKTG